MFRIVLIGLTVVSTAAATIETVPYLSLSGGLSILEDTELAVQGVNVFELSFDEGYILEAAAGVTLDRGIDTLPVRVEVALSYQENDMDQITDPLGVIGPPGAAYSDDSTAGALALMLNGYLDFPTDYNIIPFVMAGIGGANIDFDVDDATVLAGQVGGGIGYALNERLILDLKYKYFFTEKFDVLGVARTNAQGHQLQLGLRVQF